MCNGIANEISIVRGCGDGATGSLKMKAYGYLEDRLFQVSLGLYAANRLVILPHFSISARKIHPWIWAFLHGHLDDTLLIPAALPVVLWIQRRTSLRNHDRPPSFMEIASHTLIWTLICKFIGPLAWHWGAEDPWDVLCFVCGGLVSWILWQKKWRFSTRATDDIAPVHPDQNYQRTTP